MIEKEMEYSLSHMEWWRGHIELLGLRTKPGCLGFLIKADLHWPPVVAPFKFETFFAFHDDHIIYMYIFTSSSSRQFIFSEGCGDSVLNQLNLTLVKCDWKIAHNTKPRNSNHNRWNYPQDLAGSHNKKLPACHLLTSSKTYNHECATHWV